MFNKIKLVIVLWWKCMWYASYSIRLHNKAIKYYKKARKVLQKKIKKEDRSCVICKATTYTDLADMYGNMAAEFDKRSEIYKNKLQKYQ